MEMLKLIQENNKQREQILKLLTEAIEILAPFKQGLEAVFADSSNFLLDSENPKNLQILLHQLECVLKYGNRLEAKLSNFQEILQQKSTLEALIATLKKLLPPPPEESEKLEENSLDAEKKI